MSAIFAIPHGAVTAEPRIVGTGPFAGRVTEISFTRTEKSLDLAKESSLKLAAAGVEVSLSGRDGSFTVKDQRSGRHWESCPPATAYLVTALSQPSTHEVVLDLVQTTTLQRFCARYTLEGSGELIVTLESDGELGAAFDYPGAIASTAGDRLVLPYAEGIGIPVDEELGWHNGISRRVKAYGTLSMPIGGVFSDKTGAGWMTILETPDDAALQLSRQGEGRLWTFAPSWDAQLGKFGYARKVRYVFFAQGGHVAMAKRYRAHAKAEGLLKTFVEKRKERPDIDRLIGAVNVWCWEDPVKTVGMLQTAGIQRILWSGGGSAAALTELAKNPDVLAGCYDVYQDVYHPDLMAKIGKPGEKGVNGEAWPHDILWTGPTSNDWGRAWSVKATDGSWVYCARMCDARAPDYARRKVGDDLKTKPYRARFIDTTYAATLRECWNPAHPMTRSDCRRHRAALVRVISGELGLVAGSEDGKADAVPVCDYFEGMLSIGPYRVPDSGRNITQIWTNVPAATLKYQVGEKYRLPLWELVFHDCTCAHWYWGDYSNKLPALWLKRDLFNALYGTMPMFMFNRKQWEKDKERFVTSYARTAPIARATGYSEMTGHHVLTEDRTVQRTTFANGVVVTVNFGDNPFRAPDGVVIPPLDSHVTGIKR